MEITVADIAEFQALYYRYFNTEIDKHTARKKLADLLIQLATVYTPISLDNIEYLLGTMNMNQRDKYERRAPAEA